MDTLKPTVDRDSNSHESNSTSEEQIPLLECSVPPASPETTKSQTVLSASESKQTDTDESDSEAEHFEDAMEGFVLDSPKAGTRTTENEAEIVNEKLLTENCDNETGEESRDDVINEEVLREQESRLTEEEKQERTREARRLKDLGNEKFKECNYTEAIVCYSDALMACLLNKREDRAIIYSNRAAAYMKLEKYDDAIRDSSKALEHNPDYMKALLRRAELYERAEKLDEALEDYKKAFDRDPSLHQARAACMRLPGQINEHNEKLKTEMMGKLKDLGNLVLRPFGLSTDNFKLQQDPTTGSYNVSFQQSHQ